MSDISVREQIVFASQSYVENSLADSGSGGHSQPPIGWEPVADSHDGVLYASHEDGILVKAYKDMGLSQLMPKRCYNGTYEKEPT